MSDIEIWTDGGCQGNPGPGGWAYVIRVAGREQERAGFDPRTTNNRMELIAVQRALEDLGAVPGAAAAPITIHTDSQYVQKGITSWIHTWERNGWRTSGKKPVKNSELWLALSTLARGKTIRWVWVMGHAGNEMNERCDSLVQQAIGRGLKRPD